MFVEFSSAVDELREAKTMQMPDEELRKTIARTFLNDAELQLETMPSTLQDLIDAVPDHNQQMLDAVRAVDEDLHTTIVHELVENTDPDNDVYAVVNALFETAKILLETPS